MNDRCAQFMIAVGDLCTAAGLAGLEVEMRRDRVTPALTRGIPYPQRAVDGGEEIDETGYTHTLIVDGLVIDLAEVEACTIYAPPADSDD